MVFPLQCVQEVTRVAGYFPESTTFSRTIVVGNGDVGLGDIGLGGGRLGLVRSAQTAMENNKTTLH